MIKKTISIFMLIIFSVPLLSSCYDYKEPNDIAYIVAIGIDKSENEGLFDFTLQFARPSQISGGSKEEGGSGKETIGMVNVEAPSIYSALNVSNHVISKNFTLSHTKIIVISKELASEGITVLIDAIARSSDIRPNVFICVSNKEAGEYLSSVNPVIEINPVKYYRLIFENPNSSYFTKTTAKEVYENLRGKRRECVLPLVGVADKSQSMDNEGSKGGEQGTGGQGAGEQGTGGQEAGGQGTDGAQSSQNKEQPSAENKNIPINYSGFEYNMKEYIAGELDIKKQNNAEVIGAGVFKGDKFAKELTGLECEIYNMIVGDFQNGYSVIYEEKSPKEPSTIRLEQTKKPKIEVNVKNQIPEIKISLTLEGNFMSVSNSYYLENDLDRFEDNTTLYIKNAVLEFINKMQKETNADIFGFCDYAKREFLTNEEYEKYNFKDKFKDAKISVNVDFGIRKTGLIKRGDD